jgi:hypothetical protein
LIDSYLKVAIIEAEYNSFITTVQIKPKSITVGVTLQSFDIFDRISKDTQFKKIIERSGDDEENKKSPLLNIFVEKNPKSGFLQN